MANKCNHCGKFLSHTDGAKCNKCNSVYHRLCAGVSPDSRLPVRWMCLTCREPQSKTKSSTIAQSPTSEDTFTDASSVDTLIQSTESSLAKEIKLLRLELISVTREMTSFRLEISRLNDNVVEFNKRVDSVEERLTVLEDKCSNNKNNSNTNSVINNTIDQLRSDINEREQYTLLNDVQITGIPEQNGENVLHLAQTICNKVGITLETRDIVSAERTGARRLVPSTDGRQRPRSVIVRLARRALRDDILRAARVRRGIDTSGVTGGEPSRVYINEHLTRINRQLFHKAREEGKRHGWRYMWTRDGRIHMRREMDTTVQRIKTEKDIIQIFGLNQIGL